MGVWNWTNSGPNHQDPASQKNVRTRRKRTDSGPDSGHEPWSDECVEVEQEKPARPDGIENLFANRENLCEPVQKTVLRLCPDQPTPPREPPALFPPPLLPPTPSLPIGRAAAVQLRAYPHPQPHQPGARGPNCPAEARQEAQTTQKIHRKPGTHCGTRKNTYLDSKARITLIAYLTNRKYD